jgi:type II secretory pathway pseudopilin PulG
MEMERRTVVRIANSPEQRGGRHSDGGFSLIEVVVSMLVLTVGVLSLVGVTALGIKKVGSSSNQLIAREKAREAIESVHAARDTGRLTWPNIRNVGDGGIFIGGAQPLRLAGVDGLINTADDAAADMEALRSPGDDGTLGTGDDEVMPLTDYSRELVITPIIDPVTSAVNPNLRRITVNIGYRVDSVRRFYTLTTYVSAFS